MINSTVKFSKIEDRLDAEYYKPEYINLRCLFNAQTKKLEDVAENLSGYAFPSEWFREDAGIPTVKMSQITSDWVVNLQNAKYLPMTKKEEFKEFLVCKNDVLVALTGATIGNSAIYIDDQQSLLNQRVQAIRAKNVSPYYLLALLSTKCFKNYIDYLCGGGARQNISPKDVIKFPLLANDISEKISDIIKEAILKRQLARQKYQEARELINKFLKIGEQKLDFKNCFSLPFSKIEDRIDGEYYQPKYFQAAGVLKNSGCKIIRLGDITSKIYYGTSQKVIYQKQGVPFLRVTDVDNFYDIEPENCKFISKIEADALQSYAVRKDDLIISRTGTLGSMVYIDEKLNGSIFGSYFIKVVPKKDAPVLPLFVSIFLNSKIGKLQSERFASGGIQTNLTIETIKNLSLPILRKTEQEKLCSLYQDAILARRDSKELLDQAKQKVERSIEK